MRLESLVYYVGRFLPLNRKKTQKRFGRQNHPNLGIGTRFKTLIESSYVVN